jgi:deazaflavin-dependent oxidoreductase (nitroreductase family)
MAKRYRLGTGTRLINWTFRRMTEHGIGASYRYILTVPGRKSGQLHSTPVDVIDHGGSLWLVAGYGPANWVHNAQSAGQVTLSRGGRSERFAVQDVESIEAVPVLRKYMGEVRVTSRYFDATADSPDDAISAELPRHPVLRLKRAA